MTTGLRAIQSLTVMTSRCNLKRSCQRMASLETLKQIVTTTNLHGRKQKLTTATTTAHATWPEQHGRAFAEDVLPLTCVRGQELVRKNPNTCVQLKTQATSHHCAMVTPSCELSFGEDTLSTLSKEMALAPLSPSRMQGKVQTEPCWPRQRLSTGALHHL